MNVLSVSSLGEFTTVWVPCIRGGRVTSCYLAVCDVFQLHQYQVVGRKQPTEAEPTPTLFRMRLFARNKVLAVSKFWYLLKKMKKVKRSKGEILAVNELREKRATYVKNFGIWLRYDSRTGTHNMYKEVRDISQAGAVSQLYAEMAGRHRALPSNIQVYAEG